MASEEDQAPGYVDYEERTRVYCHLPLNTQAADNKVASDLMNLLQDLRKKSVNLKGYTKTVEFPTVMEGFWRTSTRKQFLKEDVVMFIIDFELNIRDPRLWQTISDLKKFISTKYEQYTGRPQDEVWIVAHSIFRLK